MEKSVTRSVTEYWPWMVGVIGLPLAALGLLLLPNEYESWGGSGVDCDGPFLLAFSLPAVAIYLTCAVGFMRHDLRVRGWPSYVGAISCFLLVGLLGANSIAAVKEMQRPDHQESCM